jgi:hypothetical protein
LQRQPVVEQQCLVAIGVGVCDGVIRWRVEYYLPAYGDAVHERYPLRAGDDLEPA